MKVNDTLCAQLFLQFYSVVLLTGVLFYRFSHDAAQIKNPNKESHNAAQIKNPFVGILNLSHIMREPTMRLPNRSYISKAVQSKK